LALNYNVAAVAYLFLLVCLVVRVVDIRSRRAGRHVPRLIRS